MQLDALKAAAAYSNSQAFASKWFVKLSKLEAQLVTGWVDSLTGTKSTKAIASYKSLVSRFLVTGKLSEGKSGDSQKSAIRSFIRFCEELEKLNEG